MKKYRIVFCWINTKGEVITDESGDELYYIEYVHAAKIENALFVFNKMFKDKPEVIEIVEVK